MTDITTSQANAVPLVERLRSVPSYAVLRMDTPNALGCMDTRSIPVGRLCHEAAEALTALSHARSVAPGGLTDEQIESVWDKLLRTHGQHSREGRIAIARAILAATPTTVHPTPADGGELLLGAARNAAVGDDAPGVGGTPE
jgi:hypothetical protein